MANSERFDDKVSRWLEETAPARIPERVLNATFERTRTTRQHVGLRVLLGRFDMFRLATALGGAAIVVVVAALALNLYVNQQGIGALPTPTTSPTAAPTALRSPVTQPPPPLTERFDSSLNGISIDYPAGWQTRPATELWTDGVLSFGASGVDIIFDPTRPEDLYLAMASEPLRGRSDDVWAGDLTLPSCPGGHGGAVLTFDGASGWVVRCGNSPARESALLVTDTRGYAFVLYLGDGGLADTFSSQWFVSLLETVDLRAEDGLDASSPSVSP